MIIIIMIITIIIITNDKIQQIQSVTLIIHKKSFFLYYRQNLINITITIISIHASLKGNYNSILKNTT